MGSLARRLILAVNFVLVVIFLAAGSSSAYAHSATQSDATLLRAEVASSQTTGSIESSGRTFSEAKVHCETGKSPQLDDNGNVDSNCCSVGCVSIAFSILSPLGNLPSSGANSNIAISSLSSTDLDNLRRPPRN